MPLHVPPITRRGFLARGALAFGGLATLGAGPRPGIATDPDFFALLADTHIPGDPAFEARETNMTANLRRVVAELVALPEAPAAVILDGDCAFNVGLPEDYANLADCVGPLAEAGLPLHLTMGNHDDRGPLYDAIEAQRPDDPPVASKHVGIVEAPLANWFLLDSLFEVNVVTGELGEEQREWLSRSLDERRDRPAIVVAHHNPQFQPPEDGGRWGGIRDTDPLFRILADREHVKAFVYGHTHNWSIDERDGLHLINLPPVGYVFRPELPNGWVRSRLLPDGIALELRTIDPDHPQNGERHELAWR